MTHPTSSSEPRLSEIYHDALDEVYRYLHGRCGDHNLAEELTSATFVQAALAIERGQPVDVHVGWLITVARHKLIDHWRHQAVVDRTMPVLAPPAAVEPWDAVLDHERANQVLAEVRPQHRAALTLRYLDDLSVPECADVLGKSVHATESLLVRARQAFRTAYEQTGGRDD